MLVSWAGHSLTSEWFPIEQQARKRREIRGVFFLARSLLMKGRMGQ